MSDPDLNMIVIIVFDSKNYVSQQCAEEWCIGKEQVRNSTH